ncbi:MAG: zinc-ribbon domain-containing protein [Candidatus Asgardarchaeia archaeon]
MICKNCGRIIPDGSLYCPFCGAKQDITTQQAPSVPPVNPPPTIPAQPYYPQTVTYKEKDEGITAILALVGGFFGIWGIGHLYVGDVKKGILLLILGLVIQFFPLGYLMLFLVSPITVSPGPGPSSTIHQTMFSVSFFGLMVWGIIAFAIFIWQVIDAYNTAKRYNEYLRTHGVPPW